ncbi:uncharacterized protein KRP23_13061 [Phytophthora ramorum]|uniref:uncharacterized protein n=1 Tax=Phytophthora ramorum TaxID=164328 RepID=UPI0030B6F867|nr:hypothetical protein KRP23_13061 [Phytophthora ramorum]
MPKTHAQAAKAIQTLRCTYPCSDADSGREWLCNKLLRYASFRIHVVGSQGTGRVWSSSLYAAYGEVQENESESCVEESRLDRLERWLRVIVQKVGASLEGGEGEHQDEGQEGEMHGEGMDTREPVAAETTVAAEADAADEASVAAVDEAATADDVPADVVSKKRRRAPAKAKASGAKTPAKKPRAPAKKAAATGTKAVVTGKKTRRTTALRSRAARRR